MKQISKILFISIIILYAYTACKMGIIQTDKPLRDVLTDKIWKADTKKKPSENTVIYFKFKNDGHILAGKPDAECYLTDADTFPFFKWEVEGNNKFFMIINTDTSADTIIFNVEKYSEKILLGTSEHTYPNDGEESKFKFKVCE